MYTKLYDTNLYVTNWGWLWHGNGLYKSRFLDGCPDGSGTKTKLYEPVSQIVRPVSQFVWY